MKEDFVSAIGSTFSIVIVLARYILFFNNVLSNLNALL